MVDLRTDDGLRRACESVDFDSEKTRTFVEEVANASRKCFFSEKYQKRLWRWRCNPICFAGGQAPQVEVHRLIQDDGFLDWFYAKYDEIRSLESQDRTEPLCEFKNRLLERVTRFSSIPPKRPKLVTYRALAALFPENFTCLASEGEGCDCHGHFGRGSNRRIPRRDAARSDCCWTERSSSASAVCTVLACWLGSAAKGHRRTETGGLASTQPNLGHLRAMVLCQNKPVGEAAAISQNGLERPVGYD